MKTNQTTCDPGRVELFLDQKLNDEEQSAFESHLSRCGDCRRRLETAAASDDIWSDVCDSLRDNHVSQDDQIPDDSAAGEDVSSGQATILKLLAPTDDDRMIGRWGTYEVVGVVGKSGMGVVLKAFDAALNRYVAIKILAPHLGTSGAAIRRFSREGKAAAAVVHDNVIEIYGVAESAGLPYLVMPYVRGPSLQRRLDDEGPLAVVEILRVAMQAAAGLAAAHAQGLVHRDVKPANILLADGIERVKLTDFGLARAADDASLTRTGVIAGTPQYMSPEQARGDSVDPRSDLFSMGSVLYAMCTGRPPFRAETSYGVLRRITDEEPRPIREINPDIPDWLCGIVAKLMAKRPDDRFQSAQEVAALLEQCLAHVQQPTVEPLPDVLLSLCREENITTERDEYGSANPNPTRQRGIFRASIATAIGLFFFGGLILAFGILIHIKKDNKTTTVEVSEGSTAHVDDQGAVTVELPSSATKPSNHAAESPALMAKHFVDLCSHGEFDKAAAYLDDALKEKVPPARLKEYWNRAGGNLQGEPEVTIENSNEYQIAHVPLNWEHKNIDFKVSFNKHDRIAWLEPSPLPNTILPLDVLYITVTGAPEDQPINGYYVVEPDGNVALGPIYGRVNLLGLRLEQAEAKTVKHLKTVLAAPAVQIAFSCRLTPWHAVAFPRSPYTIEPMDLLHVEVANAPPEDPIDNYFLVEDEGTIALGPDYGRVQVKGMTLEAAEEAVHKKLEGLIKKPKVQIGYQYRSLCETARPKAPYMLKPDDLVYIDVADIPPGNPIQGIFSVEPGGTVSLGTAYGRADVKGMSLGNAEKAIKKKLQEGGALEPAVSVTLAGWISNLSSGVSPGPFQRYLPDRPVAYGKAPRARTGAPFRKKGDSVWVEPTDLSHPRAVPFDGEHYAKVEPPKFTSRDFTMSLWFYPMRKNAGFLLMRGFSYRDQRGDIGLSLYRQEGSLDFKAATGSNQWIFGWHPQSRLHGDVRYDRWNHAAVTRRGDTYTMWMNGAPVATEKSPADISDADNSNPFIVGGMMDAGGVTATFLGELDDFRVLRRCLSEKEIADLYKASGDEGFLHGEGRVKFGPLIAAPEIEATRGLSSSVELPRAAAPPAVTASGGGVSAQRTFETELRTLAGNWKVVRIEKGKEANAAWGSICRFYPEVDPATTSSLSFAAQTFWPYKPTNIYLTRVDKLPRVGIDPRDGYAHWFRDVFDYSVDPSTAPKSIDLLGLMGHPELGALGIYEIRSGQLKICLSPCPAPIKSGRRPKGFTVDPDSAEILFVLERYQPSADQKAIEEGREWKVVSQIQDGKPVPAEEFRDTLYYFDGIVQTFQAKTVTSIGNYILDPTKRPKQITIHAMAINHDTETIDLVGIYKLEGTRLTIAYRKDGPAPSDFESKPGSKVTLLTLQGPPKVEVVYVRPTGVREATARPAGGPAPFGEPYISPKPAFSPYFVTEKPASEQEQEIVFGALQKHHHFSCPGYSIDVKETDDRKLKRVTLIINADGGSPKITCTAEEAELQSDRTKGVLKILLRNGRIDSTGRASMDFGLWERELRLSYALPRDSGPRPALSAPHAPPDSTQPQYKPRK